MSRRIFAEPSAPFVPSGLFLWAWASALTCATTPPQPPERVPAPEPDVAPGERPDAAAAPEGPADAAPVEAGAPPAVPIEGPRLAWVNPARCHPSCAFDPTPNLVRVDIRGERRENGRFLVDAQAQAPLRDLIAAAWAAGHKVRLSSAYRSYDEQARVFATTPEPGRAARPGHSEHQLGTAVDLRLPFAAAADWLRANAAAFGFVLSYPDGRQRITGYRPEPWHFRFVGSKVAALARERGLSLEELFRQHPELGASGSCADCPSPESRAPCGELTAAGRCAGTVLTWCYEGTVTTVDCAATQQLCRQNPETGVADCS